MSKFTIWGQPDCYYCKMAKLLLTRNNLVYEYKEIGTDVTKEDLIKAVPNARSVPQIFHDDTYVGGYTELAKYLLK